MKKLLVLAALLATVGVACVPPPPPPPPPPADGGGCRALPSSDASTRWDGSYTGYIEMFAGQTCAGPVTARWRALQVPHDGGGAGSSEVGNAACLEVATPLLPTDLIQIIGPNMTIWYKDLVDGNEGNSTGIPKDVYACAVAYLDSQGIVSVWPGM